MTMLSTNAPLRVTDTPSPAFDLSTSIIAHDQDYQRAAYKSPPEDPFNGFVLFLHDHRILLQPLLLRSLQPAHLTSLARRVSRIFQLLDTWFINPRNQTVLGVEIARRLLYTNLHAAVSPSIFEEKPDLVTFIEEHEIADITENPASIYHQPLALNDNHFPRPETPFETTGFIENYQSDGLIVPDHSIIDFQPPSPGSPFDISAPTATLPRRRTALGRHSVPLPTSSSSGTTTKAPKAQQTPGTLQEVPHKTTGSKKDTSTPAPTNATTALLQPKQVERSVENPTTAANAKLLGPKDSKAAKDAGQSRGTRSSTNKSKLTKSGSNKLEVVVRVPAVKRPAPSTLSDSDDTPLRKKTKPPAGVTVPEPRRAPYRVARDQSRIPQSPDVTTSSTAGRSFSQPTASSRQKQAEPKSPTPPPPTGNDLVIFGKDANEVAAGRKARFSRKHDSYPHVDPAPPVSTTPRYPDAMTLDLAKRKSVYVNIDKDPAPELKRIELNAQFINPVVNGEFPWQCDQCHAHRKPCVFRGAGKHCDHCMNSRLVCSIMHRGMKFFLHREDAAGRIRLAPSNMAAEAQRARRLRIEADDFITKAARLHYEADCITALNTVSAVQVMSMTDNQAAIVAEYRRTDIDVADVFDNLEHYKQVFGVVLNTFPDLTDPRYVVPSAYVINNPPDGKPKRKNGVKASKERKIGKAPTKPKGKQKAPTQLNAEEEPEAEFTNSESEESMPRRRRSLGPDSGRANVAPSSYSSNGSSIVDSDVNPDQAKHSNADSDIDELCSSPAKRSSGNRCADDDVEMADEADIRQTLFGDQDEYPVNPRV